MRKTTKLLICTIAVLQSVGAYGTGGPPKVKKWPTIKVNSVFRSAGTVNIAASNKGSSTSVPTAASQPAGTTIHTPPSVIVPTITPEVSSSGPPPDNAGSTLRELRKKALEKGKQIRANLKLSILTSIATVTPPSVATTYNTRTLRSTGSRILSSAISSPSVATTSTTGTLGSSTSHILSSVASSPSVATTSTTGTLGSTTSLSSSTSSSSVPAPSTTATVVSPPSSGTIAIPSPDTTTTKSATSKPVHVDSSNIYASPIDDANSATRGSTFIDPLPHTYWTLPPINADQSNLTVKNITASLVQWDKGKLDEDEVFNAVYTQVTGKRTALAVAKVLTDHHIDLATTLRDPELMNHEQYTDDNIVSSLPSNEKKALFMAKIQQIYLDEQTRGISGGPVGGGGGGEWPPRLGGGGGGPPPLTVEEIVNFRPHQGFNSSFLYEEIPEIANAPINERMSTFIATGNPLSGKNSGDVNSDDLVNGLWVRGLYGYINQGSRTGQSGFHGRTHGGSIGIDRNLTTDIVLGISYTHMDANFKYKEGSGNKVNTRNNFFSLYGITNLNDNFMLQGLASFGITKSTQYILRPVDINTFKIATGKSTVHTYSVESILNYKMPINNPDIYIMPNIGVRYTQNHDGGYNEYGAGLFNLTVSSKQHVSCAIITGLKLGKTRIISKNLTMTPGIHVEVDHYVYNRSTTAKTKMEWSENFIDETEISVKSANKGYNLGFSLLSEYKSSEILAAYNLQIRGKYTSHQGSIKIRFLF